MNPAQQLRGYLNQLGKEFNAYSGSKLDATYGLERVQEEIREASKKIHWSNKLPTDKFVIECADIVLTLASLCAGLGLNLDEAIANKHVKNMKRLWERHPTIKGGVQHRT